MATDQRRVQSCGDLVEEIRAIKDKLSQNDVAKAATDKIRFWCRGHACPRPKYRLQPSGLRGDVRYMRAMLHEFRAEAFSLVSNPPHHSDLRQWLFLARHHGMPTLLLDWTRSALFGLFCAVEAARKCPEHDDVDGCVWVLRPGRWNQVSGATKEYALADAYSPALDALFSAHFDAGAGEGMSCALSKSVVAIEPTFNSPRIVAQQGVFTLHGPKSLPMEETHASLTEACLWELRVCKDQKRRIRQELHDLGLHLSSFFPDLDHLAQCIKRRYDTSEAEGSAGRGAEAHPDSVSQQEE